MFGDDNELRLAVRNRQARAVPSLIRKGRLVEALDLMVLIDPIDARDQCVSVITTLTNRGGLDDRLPVFKSILAKALVEIEGIK